MRCIPIILCLLSIVGINQAISQEIHINEVCSSNTLVKDTDGDSPDWIELYNSSDQPISLNGWSLSDDHTIPDKWIFPEITLNQSEFLLVFASDKDRPYLVSRNYLITEGDSARYILPDQTTDSDWKNLNFDDSVWDLGALGIGYGDNDDQTTVPYGTRSVFIRIPFEIENLQDIIELSLQIDYDDGFIATINGKEVARKNMGIIGEDIPYDAYATKSNEAKIPQRESPEQILIPEFDDLLSEGENLLTLQVHNLSAQSSDLTALPFLSVATTSEASENQGVPGIVKIANGLLHTNFKISSGGEAIYLYDDSGSLADSLAVPSLRSDDSYGRYPDGSDDLFVFDMLTPEATNVEETYRGYADGEIIFSHPPGLYDESITVSLSGADGDEKIKITKDGSTPRSFSNDYINPIVVNNNTVIRAQMHKPGYLPGRTFTHTYLLNVDHTLPIVNITTTPTNFFDYITGIYVKGPNANSEFPFFGSNFWQDWERPIHISYWEDGKEEFSMDAGTKIFGGWSRAFDLKSLSVFARAQYGTNEIDYPIFPKRNYSKYQSFVLRNAGNDVPGIQCRDVIMTGLMNNSGIDHQDHNSVIVYINGDYWGIQHMREKVNEHFIESRHGLDPEDLDLLEINSTTIHGDNADYLNLISYIQENNLAEPLHYDYVSSQVDIHNFITYQSAQIFFDNWDWPGNNIKYWRDQNDGKWKWILFDTDFGFNPDRIEFNTLNFALASNGPDWPNPPWSTRLLRRLMDNQDFKHQFINTFCDQLNSRFLASNTVGRINTVTDHLRPEITQHLERWNLKSPTQWEFDVERTKEFARQRPDIAFGFIQSRFALPSRHQVQVEIDNPDQGEVQLNTLRLTDPIWEGYYFETVPIQLTAIPKPGHTFSHWSGDVESTEPMILIDLQNRSTVTANFEEGGNDDFPIVINEINYKSNDDRDTKDWIELYNRSNETTDISDWVFKDGDDDHIFTIPASTSLGSKEFLVLTRNKEAFKEFYPDLNNVLGDFDFGLSSSGEALRLYNELGLLQDSVDYSSSHPWPTEADGEGPTLELINAFTDNNLAENWKAFPGNGTPGASNQNSTSSIDISTLPVNVFPNPFDEVIQIELGDRSGNSYQFLLVAEDGQLMHQERVQSQREYSIDSKNIPPGLYFLHIKDANNKTAIKKIIKK